MSQKIQIDALLKRDLSEYIKNLGLTNELENEELQCEICNDKLNIDTIAAIYFKEHVPKFVCNKPLCYQVIHESNKK